LEIPVSVYWKTGSPSLDSSDIFPLHCSVSVRVRVRFGAIGLGGNVREGNCPGELSHTPFTPGLIVFITIASMIYNIAYMYTLQPAGLEALLQSTESTSF